MTPPKKKPARRLSPFAQLARNARVGPGYSRRAFNVWSESAKIKLAGFMKQESIDFGSVSFECGELVVGLILKDATKKEIITILKSRFGNIQESVFEYVFKDEFSHGKEVADALVTNAAYQKAIEGNVQAIKLIGIKMGWLDQEGEGDEGEINEVLQVFMSKKKKD